VRTFPLSQRQKGKNSKKNKVKEEGIKQEEGARTPRVERGRGVQSRGIPERDRDRKRACSIRVGFNIKTIVRHSKDPSPIFGRQRKLQENSAWRGGTGKVLQMFKAIMLKELHPSPPDFNPPSSLVGGKFSRIKSKRQCRKEA